MSGEPSVLAELYSSKSGIVEIEAANYVPGPDGGVVTAVRRGAGVALDKKGTILTNKHIVGEANRVVVSTREGAVSEVYQGITSEFFDLAIIKIEPEHEMEPVELAEEHLSLGDAVYSVGSSFWIKGSIIQGRLIGIAANPASLGKEQILLRTTIKMYSGDSGAPLFNRRGRLAGMIFSKTSEGETVALPANVIKEFYQEYLKAGSAR